MKKKLFLWTGVVIFIFISACSQQNIDKYQVSTIIDWVDFVKLNGQSYSGMYNVIIKDPDDVTDQVAGEVKFKVSGVITNSNYETKDGDAAYLEIGTKLYEVNGFSKDELIAVKDENRINGYRLYAADNSKHKINYNYDHIPKEKVEKIELVGQTDNVPFRTLTDDDRTQFIELLDNGEDRTHFDADRTNGDPTYYEMVFYTDEPLAYVHILFDDGMNVFFHPNNTRVVDGEIRKFLQPQVEFIGIVQEWDDRTILVAEAENETNLIRFTVDEIPETIQKGNKVHILFNGIVAESYPGQAKADLVRMME